ncbi:MAG: adenylyltransferase/cytidyltransferase family protein [Spirochaetia bacterium]|nr:adenylyltransferase/cytidyltransferase family protein [Spirochaetia bacterium]
MNIYSWKEFTEKKPLSGVPSAITVGVFDGIHKGHMEILRQVLSQGNGIHSVVFTFRTNPALFFKGSFRGDIYTLQQKISAFQELGADTLILIDFSADFVKLSGKQFFSIIGASLMLKKIAVGYDFKCGCGNDTTSDDIVSMFAGTDVDVQVVPEYRCAGVPVKSTMIRTFIQTGELNILPELMEFGYSIDISGHMGSMLRSDTKQVLPPAGSYSMRLYDRGEYRNASITAGKTAVGWEFI